MPLNLRARAESFGIARTLVAIVILALLVWLAISRIQLARERRAHENAELAVSNAIAERDVSRRAVLSAAESMRILGDSMQALERLGVQRGDGIRRDDFDRATDRTSVVRGGITITPGTITTTTTSTTATTDSLVFHVDSSSARAGPRYVVDAIVKTPPAPAAASLQLGIRFSPIVLSPRIQCGEAVNGIRPASMAVIAPTGVAVEVERLELNARVCNEDFGRPKGWRIPVGWAAGLAGAAFVAGVVVAR